MNLKCKRTDLIEAVNFVEKAVPIKTTLPIMEGFFLEAKDVCFKLVGNNMDLGLECLIPAEVK